MELTPKEYAKKFLEMDVFIFTASASNGNGKGVVDVDSSPLGDPGSWVHTRVGSYRLGAATASKDHYYFSDLTSAVHGKKEVYTRVKRIDGWIESAAYDFKEISYAMVAPFYGKGYPEEVQIALQMRYRYQKTTYGLSDFVKAAFIGLDCNGFVGGFIERRKAQDKWMRSKGSMTSTPIREILGPPAGWFKSWDDFKVPGKNCLILAMCDEQGNVKDHTPDGGVGHIVITEPGSIVKKTVNGNTTVEFEAVESCGGIGVTWGPYKVLKMVLDRQKRAYFYIDRGGTKGKLHFRIRELEA